MPNIQRLTKESEELISSALSEVAELTNTGTPPNDAIVKVASDRGVRAGHVRLMVRAFNNGRSLGHFRDHNELHDKAASFQLADAGEILERMFPSEVPTPAEKKASVAVSDDYKLPPTGWLKRRQQSETRRGLMEKAASAEKTQKTAEYPELPERAGRKATSQLHDIRRQYERVKGSAYHAAYKVAEDVNAVGDYFRRRDSLNAEEVAINAGRRYGEPGHKLVKNAADFQRNPQPANPLRPVDWDAEPYSLVKKALDSMQHFTEKKAALEKFEQELPEKRANCLRPFPETEKPDVITGSVWDAQLQTKSATVNPGLTGMGMAGFMGGAAKGLADKVWPKSKEELVQEELNRLAAPKHEDKLRAIRLKTMIHELMVSDPVISGYDPELVMEAFNHLSEVAPRAMQQRVMAQALVRKYLEQSTAVDPFDVDQMLDVEGKIINRDMPEALTSHQLPGPMRELGPMQQKPRGIGASAPEPGQNPWDASMEGAAESDASRQQMISSALNTAFPKKKEGGS